MTDSFLDTPQSRPGTAGHADPPAPAEARPRGKVPSRRKAKAVPAAVSAPSPRDSLAARIRTVAERQIEEIEARLAREEGGGIASERDARTLAHLAKAVRELSLAESRKPAARTRPAAQEVDDDDVPPRDPEAFRLELARRLERLRQAREGG